MPEDISRVTIEMKTENAAFHDGPMEREVARLLRKMADEMERAGQVESANYCDLNGNVVARLRVE